MRHCVWCKHSSIQMRRGRCVLQDGNQDKTRLYLILKKRKPTSTRRKRKRRRQRRNCKEENTERFTKKELRRNTERFTKTCTEHFLTRLCAMGKVVKLHGIIELLNYIYC
uniref:Uncharacterized protein n=1 Tax=Cacopsylla melanoneura TaxID=428564 RepID=A0A8D8TZL3_9HEMI